MQAKLDDRQNIELLALLVQAAHAMVRVREDELRQYGISWIQAGLLFVVKSVDQPVTPAKISRWLFREPHTIFALLELMVNKGLVRKTKDLARKNMVRVTLTKKGEQVYKSSVAKREASFRVLSCLTHEERDNLRAVLKKLRDTALQELGIRYKLPYPLDDPLAADEPSQSWGETLGSAENKTNKAMRNL